uniref:energy-coupling factor ABC transporter ATP-binding protein n=1 Tax=Methanosarcina horonobensis TaxID=418008 RepID=UPI0022B8D3A8|nr:ATP-binding cassette domain-containing protein [Methanosarcina horonobensis]
MAFVGQNGSGKSTLFLLLNGTLKPQEGEILFHGAPFKYDSKSLREIRKSVGSSFRTPMTRSLPPLYTRMWLSGRQTWVIQKKVDASVQHALEHVGLTRLKDKPPHHLSGGQKKRVAIAGVMAMEPEVIILDEPLSNLDPVGADEIMDLLNEFNHFGSTIIISTHDVDLAYRWSDYVYLMSNSKLIGQGTPAEVFKEQDLLKKAGLRQPTTLEIYHEIERRGLAYGKNSPKTVPDLVNTLKPLDLMWVEVPPESGKGTTLTSGSCTGNMRPSLLTKRLMPLSCTSILTAGLLLSSNVKALKPVECCFTIRISIHFQRSGRSLKKEKLPLLGRWARKARLLPSRTESDLMLLQVL